MLKIMLAGLLVLATTSATWAACPPGTSYQCYQGYNGKVVCSCR